MIERESQKIEAFTSQLYQKSILDAMNGKFCLRVLTLLAHLSFCSIIGYIEILSEVLWNKDQHNIN